MIAIKKHDTVISNARRLALSALVASLAMASPGMATAQAAMPGHAGMAAGTAKPAEKSTMPMHEAMEGMHKKMSSMTMSGKPDMDFAVMMVVHHQAAIDMAKAELASGKDPVMLAMAGKIIAAQGKEIAQLEAWMKKSHQK